MHITPGDRVVIVDNLGIQAKRSAGEYYHGGTPKEVPLGSEHPVMEVDGGRITIDTRSVKTGIWHLHHDEVEPSILPEVLEMLDEHPLLLAAGREPFAVMDGGVYVGTEGESDARITSGIFKRVSHGLTKTGTIGDYDSIFGARAAAAANRAQESFVRRTVARLASSARTDLSTKQLVVSQVVPRLTAEHYEQRLHGLLDEGIPEARGKEPDEREPVATDATIIDGLRKIAYTKVRQISEMQATLQKGRDANERRLDRILGAADGQEETVALELALREGLVIFNGNQQALTAPSWRGTVIENGRVAGLRPIEYDLPMRIKESLAAMSRTIRIQALESLTPERIDIPIGRAYMELLTCDAKSAYDKEGCGFIKNEDKIYAYLTVPDFAIKSHFDGKMYLFRKARIGIWVGSEDGKLTYSNKIQMIDNNNHPFLHNNRASYADICVGDQKFPTSGEDTGDVIAKRLRRGKEVLMYGYTSNDYQDSYKLRDNGYFKDNLCTPEMIAKSGVPVIVGGARS